MATNVSHRIPTAQAPAIADRTGADIIYLTGTETIQELRQRGLPESTAHAARKRGYYCPQYNRRHYPQHEGAGGFAQLETPERFVRAYVLRTLAQWEIAPSPDLVADLTQDGLLACWHRRHAPHIQNFPRYYAAMLRGLVTQHCKRLQREQQRLRPWEEAGPC